MRRWRSAAAGAWLGVLSVCGCASAPEAVPERAPEPVKVEPPGTALRFGWPANLRARVGVEVRDGSANGPRIGAASYEMTTAPTAEGLRIDYDEVRVAQAFALGDVPARVVEALVRLRPSLRVDRTGALLGLVDVQARIAAELRGLQAEPEYAELLQRRATPEALRAEAAAAWHDLIEFWAGERLESGRTYWIRSVGPLPLVEGEEVEVVTRYALRAGVPCDAYDPANGCVLLTVQVEPDAASVAAAVQRLNRAAIARAEGKNLQLVPRIEQVEASTQLELLTEPKTLLPRRLTRLRSSLKVVTEAGERIEERSRRHEQHSYQYLVR